MTAAASKSPVLVAGVGPLPPEYPERLFAPGLRIWGMARELAGAGHPVRLICAEFGGGHLEGKSRVRRFELAPGVGTSLPDGKALETGPDGLPGVLAREAESSGAAAAVGSTDVMNHALALAELKVPIWMDYFGDPMAERQLLAMREGGNQGLANQWAVMAPALARADRLSGCSREACGALLGQLAVLGRLGRHTAGEPLVQRLPPWHEPIAPARSQSENPVVRGRLTPPDAFIIVQTGGFNTWLDVETLHASLERAMAANPDIHFAAGGGAIPGHHAGAFERFERAVAGGRHHERFHMLGWLPLGQVPRVIGEGDMGLNVDIECAEGILGTRNRLLDWLAGGLPVVSTPGCELARKLGERGHLQLEPHADAEAIAAAVLRIVARPGPAREAAKQGARYIEEAHAPARCLAPLLEWAADPKPASDLHTWASGTEHPPALHDQARRGAEQSAELQRLAGRVTELEGKLSRILGSRLVRLALKLRGRNDL